MKRGDLVTIALQGDFGKPRPALVIQADLYQDHASVTVLPVTSLLIAAPLLRVTIEANDQTGLQQTSQVMVDKPMTVKRDKASPAFGRVNAMSMLEIERCLAVFLGLAK
jgi:mRNA interferase MazF